MNNLTNDDFLEIKLAGVILIGVILIGIILIGVSKYFSLFSKKNDYIIDKSDREKEQEKKKEKVYQKNPGFFTGRSDNQRNILTENQNNESDIDTPKQPENNEIKPIKSSIDTQKNELAQQGNVIIWNNLDEESKYANSNLQIESKYNYLQAAVNGKFLRLFPSEEKCYFRTWKENGERKYEFYGNIKKALANINAIFDDVCEIAGRQNGATFINNVEPGILDEDLKIIKKAKIKLT